VFINSSLRKHPQTEVARLLKIRGVSNELTVSNRTPIYTLTGPSGELPFAPQLPTAPLSELDLDLDHYRSALAQYGGEQQRLMKTPGAFALRSALCIYSGGDRRIGFTPGQAFAIQRGNDEANSWLRAYVLEGSLEIGLVGDFNPDDVEKTATASIGTLKRHRPDRVNAPLTNPTRAIRQEGSDDLPAITSLSCVLWPVALPDERKSTDAL
jgi:hypothetical protein